MRHDSTSHQLDRPKWLLSVDVLGAGSSSAAVAKAVLEHHRTRAVPSAPGARVHADRRSVRFVGKDPDGDGAALAAESSKFLNQSSTDAEGDASRGSQRSHSGRAQGGVGMKDLDGRQRPCRRVIYVPEQQVVPFISEEPPRLRARRSRTRDGTERPLPPRPAAPTGPIPDRQTASQRASPIA
jgi:hypothetical protein